MEENKNNELSMDSLEQVAGGIPRGISELLKVCTQELENSIEELDVLHFGILALKNQLMATPVGHPDRAATENALRNLYSQFSTVTRNMGHQFSVRNQILDLSDFFQRP